ncbi:MAG TPA: hypothetical protein GX497_05495 [Bacillus bacterium]|nr:hypothetical protein [Bacillus sp. (in: firmicutes)]
MRRKRLTLKRFRKYRRLISIRIQRDWESMQYRPLWFPRKAVTTRRFMKKYNFKL